MLFAAMGQTGALPDDLTMTCQITVAKRTYAGGLQESCPSFLGPPALFYFTGRASSFLVDV